MLIHDLPDQLRPRERMAQHGPESLGNAELLAIFLRVGVRGESAIDLGERLLREYGGLAALGRLEMAQLAREHGLGPAKAAQLVAAFELGARTAREELKIRPLDSPATIYRTFAPQLSHLPHESLRLALLDTRLRATRFITLSNGSVNETIAHPREILQPVILHKAYGFVLVHNHPSGDPTPSRADRDITCRLTEAADLMQVRFIEHLIVGRSSSHHDPYFSFAEAGLI